MLRKYLLAGFAMVLALVSCDDIPAPPNPPRLVNDFAGIFSESQVDSLEHVLVDFDKRTTNQICVVTVKTLAGMEVDDFGLQLANRWGIGTKQHQNGVLLLIKPRGRDNDYIDVTIQVGRGLEGAIPDAYASRIIRNVMGPYLKRDQYWPAVVKACEDLMGLASGEISEPRTEEWSQRFSRLKQDVKSGFHNFIHGLFVGILGFLGLGLFFAIVLLIEKRNDKRKKKEAPDKREEKTPVQMPVIDPSIDDVSSNASAHQLGSKDIGGFDGFGGGGFGGGGASGRF